MRLLYHTLVTAMLIGATLTLSVPGAPAFAEDSIDHEAALDAIDEPLVERVLQAEGWSFGAWDTIEITPEHAAELARDTGIDATTVKTRALFAEREGWMVTVEIVVTGEPNYPDSGTVGWDRFFGHARLGAGLRSVAVRPDGWPDDVEASEARSRAEALLEALIAATE